MGKLRIFMAVAACRLSGAVLRLLGRGGTSLPGKIALAICPGLLKALSDGVKTVLVTGTNGKTTTSRIIEEAVGRSGKSCFANRSGANLLGGVTAAFAQHSTVFGKCRREYAVIECDEAAFAQVTGHVDARCAVITNVFRDQLDRYGEISRTVEKLSQGVRNLKNAVLCINADCSLSSSVAEGLPNEIIYYGIEGERTEDARSELSDAPFCMKCGGEYRYEYVTYGHLGGFVCPGCGYRHHEKQVAVTKVLSEDSEGADVRMRVFGEDCEVRVGLPGQYNLYNAAAAIAAAVAMGIPRETAAAAAGEFECGFGRLEKIELGQAKLRMVLVKNPAGLNQALSVTSGGRLALLLSDLTADGTDVSWIWDADFESLAEREDAPETVYVSGRRAEDLALRLRYAGVAEAAIRVEKDPERLLDLLEAESGEIYVLPTYTAMLDLRARLGRRTKLRDFWE